MSEFMMGPRDHATEGAVIGAALLGVGGLALRLAFGRNGSESDHRLGRAAEAGAVLALAGAVAGALIGGAVEEPEVPVDGW